MIGAAYSQGRQALQQGSAPHTGQYYSGKQKDTQIVRISGSDAEQMVVIPNLRPHFFNAAEINGAQMQDITYLVRSFCCHNRFFNVEKGMSVRVEFTVTIGEGEMLDPDDPPTFEIESFVKLDPFALTINIAPESPEVVTAEQLCDRFQNEFERTVIQASQNDANIPYLQMKQQYQNGDKEPFSKFILRQLVFNYVKFGYDYTSGKFALVLSPRYPIPVDGFDRACRLADLKVIVTTQDLSQTSLQIAKLFGMRDINEEAGCFADKFDVDPSDLEYAVLSRYPDAFGDGFPSMQTLQNSFTPKLYTFLYQMNVMRHSKLYIRSSLMNTFWNQNGTKSDIIAVIPLQAGMDQTISEYTLPGDSGRNYEVKETASGAGSFGIRITDEWDNLVHFLEDYELTIAFFFNPAYNQVSQF